MSVNYNSKKKPELEALLKERGLPHTGNKPDLVARLQEHDASGGDTSGAAVTVPAADEDKIDWDDEDANAAESNLAAAQATDVPANKAMLEAGGIGRVDNPVDVPNQVVDEANDPGRTEDLKIAEAPATTDPAAPTAEQIKEEAEAKQKAYNEKFGANLAASEAQREADKRAARAARFGAMAVESDAEAKKKEERAAKFGTGTDQNEALAKLLDGALPERRERKRGRDRGDRGDVEGRGGVHKRVDSRRRDQRPRGPAKPAMRDADRQAMDRRAQRFGASAN